MIIWLINIAVSRYRGLLSRKFTIDMRSICRMTLRSFAYPSVLYYSISIDHALYFLRLVTSKVYFWTQRSFAYPMLLLLN